ncbi:MAG: hypothetical protein AAFW73_10860, partial [Bacteroidota bacterium]
DNFQTHPNFLPQRSLPIMDIKKIISEYEGEEGSPIASALDLFTFAKFIPWHLGKAVGLSLLLYLGLNFVLFQLDAGFFLSLLGLVLGLIWAFLLGMTASVNFIAGGLIQTFAELLANVLHPIDRMYDRWRAQERDASTDRTAFTQEVVQEFVLPELRNALGFLPFKGRVLTAVESMVEGIFEKGDGTDPKSSTAVKAGVSPAEDQKAQSSDYVDGLIQKVDENRQRARSRVATPFWKVMGWGLLFWGLLLVVHFVRA